MARASDPSRARTAATWIVRTLHDAGHIAYFAGGCVRDGLLGLHPTDFDVATNATPQRVRSLFPRTAEVGAAFGVVLVHVPPEAAGGEPGNRGHAVTVEVATFRSDGPYSDARRPDTVHFSDPKADAERRDFTINALFLNPLEPSDESTLALAGGSLEGRIIDYVGGVGDLGHRVVRAVGDPDKRLAEDHLRALRAVRFAARLGFSLDQATAAAIKRHAAELKGVSRERIGEELRRMLGHASRAHAVHLLQSLTLDAPVLLEDSRAAEPKLLSGLPPRSSPALALAAWCLDRSRAGAGTIGPAWMCDADAKVLALRWRGALCLSNEETADLTDILAISWSITQRWAAMRVSQRKRLAAKPLFSQSLQLVRSWRAEFAGQVAHDVARLEADGIGISPPYLVTGDDLIAAGCVPSPRFKGALDETRDAQLEGRVRSKEEAMDFARRLLGQST